MVSDWAQEIPTDPEFKFVLDDESEANAYAAVPDELPPVRTGRLQLKAEVLPHTAPVTMVNGGGLGLDTCCYETALVAGNTERKDTMLRYWKDP